MPVPLTSQVHQYQLKLLHSALADEALLLRNFEIKKSLSTQNIICNEDKRKTIHSVTFYAIYITYVSPATLFGKSESKTSVISNKSCVN